VLQGRGLIKDVRDSIALVLKDQQQQN